MNTISIFTNRLNKKELLQLFLTIGFPIHTWSIIQVLYDIEWVYEQQGGGILIGYIAYSMVFALFETIVLFIFFLLLSLFFPKKWAGQYTFIVLCQWVFILSLWGVANIIYFVLIKSPPKFLSWVLLRVAYHQELGFTILLITIVLSIVLPLILSIRYEKIRSGTIAIIDRIILLSILYLVFDFIGVIIIFIRNIT